MSIEDQLSEMRNSLTASISAGWAQEVKAAFVEAGISAKIAEGLAALAVRTMSDATHVAAAVAQQKIEAALANISDEELDRALHDMGKPQPREPKQLFRDVFSHVMRQRARQEERGDDHLL